MVLTLMLPLRAVYKLEDLITQYHIDCMCKITLATGTIVGYAYLMELFVAFYSGAIYEMDAFKFRIAGPYWWAYAAMMSLNVLSPQLTTCLPPSGNLNLPGTRADSSTRR